MTARDTDRDIADVLVRYATAVDTRDWALFRTCFTAECQADYGEIGSWPGVDEFAGFMQQIHDQCGRSLHRITNIVVTGHGDLAAARSYVDAVVMFPDYQAGTRAIGYYDDQLVFTPDGWKIAQRRYTMIHLAQIEATLGGLSTR